MDYLACLLIIGFHLYLLLFLPYPATNQRLGCLLARGGTFSQDLPPMRGALHPRCSGTAPTQSKARANFLS